VVAALAAQAASKVPLVLRWRPFRHRNERLVPRWSGHASALPTMDHSAGTTGHVVWDTAQPAPPRTSPTALLRRDELLRSCAVNATSAGAQLKTPSSQHGLDLFEAGDPEVAGREELSFAHLAQLGKAHDAGTT
jgi:hypothetical protein